MKGISIFIVSLIITTVAIAQKPSRNKFPIKTVPKDKIANFIDSLKNKIIKDTIKFDKSDLIYAAIGSMNKRPYSVLFCIDGKYLYKLDIIEGRSVLKFAEQYLDVKKVETLNVLNPVDSQKLYGSNGALGVIFIHICKGTFYNPEIAGLKRYEKENGGDNFWQRKPNELFIRN